MQRKPFLALLLVLLLVVLVGCGAENNAGWDSDNNAGSPGAPPQNEAGRDYEDRDGEESLGGETQYRIRTADVSLDVENHDDALAEITRMMQQVDGFIAESNVYGTEENRQSNLVLRVPAEHMDAVLEDISSLGKQTHSNTGGSNVTLQYVDLEARIRNLERQEERLLDILDNTGTLEEILRVEQELSRVRGELESRVAEFRNLRDRVDFATISVSLRESATASPSITGSGLKGVWQRGVTGLINSVNAMMTGLGNFLVALLTVLPYLLFLLVVGLPAILLIRKLSGQGPKTPDA